MKHVCGYDIGLLNKASQCRLGGSPGKAVQRSAAARGRRPEALFFDGAPAALLRLPAGLLRTAHRALHPSPSKNNAARVSLC